MSRVPPTPHPWRIVEAEGTRWMVRRADGVIWLVRLPERTVYVFAPEKAPTWAGGENSSPTQLRLV